MAIRTMFDGLINALSGMGTTTDVRTRTGYAFVPLDRVQIEAAYRGSGLIRKIIRIPADDMVREWRDWQAERDQITALEAEERRLNVRTKVRQAEILRGLGGGALILGAPGDPAQPLPTNMGVGSLAYIHVVNRWQLSFSALVDDPVDPLFGGPPMFTMPTTRGQRQIHPSRVVCFRGDPLPELTGTARTEDSFWGESRIEAILDPAKDADAARQAFSALIQKARHTRIGIPGLLEIAATQEGEQMISRRFQALALSESNYNVTLFDAGMDGKDGEAITDHQVTWTGIPEIMNAFAMFLAAVADIPVTRLMGRAAEGMNASGDSQQRDWAKAIKARQTLQLQPCLDQLDAALIPSALGSRPAEVWWEFASLDQPTDKEEADRFATWMGAMEKLQATAAIPEVAFAKAIQTGIVENGWAPGLEGALDEIPEADRYGIEPDEDDGTDPSALTQRPDTDEPDEDEADEGARTANDAAAWIADGEPKPLYVQRKLVNAAELIAWARANGFETTLSAADMHVTVLYSRALVDPMKMGRDWREDERGEIAVRPGGPRAIERLGENAVVLRFASPDLEYRHKDLIEAGGSHDYPDYQPHVTLSYTVPDSLDLNAIRPFNGALRFGPEIFETLDLDWKSKIREA
jgi:phage-related protein (TIGR01555 family)